MITLVALAVLILIAGFVYLVYDHFDRGPVNGVGEPPVGGAKNSLDFTEGMYKWEPRRVAHDGSVRFEPPDPALVERIRQGVKL